jgi:hypothetical protein
MTIIYLAFYILLLVCSPAQAISFDEARHLHARTVFWMPHLAEIAVINPLNHAATINKLLEGVQR